MSKPLTEAQKQLREGLARWQYELEFEVGKVRIWPASVTPWEDYRDKGFYYRVADKLMAEVLIPLCLLNVERDRPVNPYMHHDAGIYQIAQEDMEEKGWRPTEELE